MTRDKHKGGAKAAAELRSRARAIREQARRAQARAASMPAGLEREMLATQADMLGEGAAELDARALAVDPVRGSA